MKQIKDVIKELLFPRRCPICDEVLPVLAVWETSRLICPACRRMVERVKIKEPVCKKCGKPIAEKRQEYCTDCERKKHEFVQGKTVFAYQDPMRESLYRFKYSNRREYADFYAEEALRHYEKWILYRKIQVIVPVPLHKSRMRRRGYNQAELFARALGERMGIPVRTDLLIREKNTVPQKELSETERKNNLKNAFKITENIVQLSYILLVDDIYTTGSTIDAATLALKRAGGTYIYFICISSGRGF